jgi:hypothetical protein
MRAALNGVVGTQDAAPAPAPSPDALVAWDGVSLEAWPELKAAAEAQLGETEDTRAAALLALRAKLDALPEARCRRAAVAARSACAARVC